MALMAVVMLVFFIQSMGKAYRTDGYDLTSYLMSARALLDGGDPYATATPFPYIYPLFLAFALIPLAVMPYWAANVIWFALGAAALFASCAVLVKTAGSEIKTGWGRHLAVPSFLLFLIALSPIQNNLLNGQANLVVLACCVMFYRQFARGKSLAAAVWLGAAIALKLMPAVLLVFLVARRRFRLAALCILFSALFCALPAFVAGRDIVAHYRTYADSFLLRGLADVGGGRASGFNLQSIASFVSPRLGESVAARALSLLVSAAFVLAVDLASIRSRRSSAHAWGFCAYCVGFLLLSPMGEPHHVVFAVPAILLIGMKAVFDERWRTGRIQALIACFVASFIAMPRWPDAKPFYFIPLSILCVLLALAARAPAPEPRT